MTFKEIEPFKKQKNGHGLLYMKGMVSLTTNKTHALKESMRHYKEVVSKKKPLKSDPRFPVLFKFFWNLEETGVHFKMDSNDFSAFSETEKEVLVHDGYTMIVDTVDIDNSEDTNKKLLERQDLYVISF